MANDEDPSTGLLLRDIKEIGKALYLHSSKSEAFSVSEDRRLSVASTPGILGSESAIVIRDSSRKDKRTSIWSWNPLRALTHVRHHRFNCCFFLQVHSVEGLPRNFDNLNLCVIWKRKGDMLKTSHAPVSAGTAEFEETLMHRCTISASKTGSHGAAKYEPKLFSLQTSVIGAPRLDIGQHWIDLTKLLPLTLEDLERQRRSLGKWTTSFELTGKAKGAVLNVSFGFCILGGNSFHPGYFIKVPDIVRVMGEDCFADLGTTSRLNKLGAFSGSSKHESLYMSQSREGKGGDGYFPDQQPVLDPLIAMLYQKLDEGKMGSDVECDSLHESVESRKMKAGSLPVVDGESTGPECNDMGFTIVDQGVEFIDDQVRIDSERFNSSLMEIIDVSDIFEEDDRAFGEQIEQIPEPNKMEHNKDEGEGALDESDVKVNSGAINEETVEGHNSVFSDDFSSELDTFPDVSNCPDQETCPKTESNYHQSLDEIAESIENDFLDMLSIEHSPARQVYNSGLITSFEQGISDTDFVAEQKESFCFSTSDQGELEPSDDIDLSLAVQASQSNQGCLTPSMRRKRNARMLESLETQSLMHEWGLNENPDYPHVSSGGFGSPVYPPQEEPLNLPSLGEGLGPIIQTRGGGLLRSMNPLIFINAEPGARLIVQVSAPLVLPAVVGSTAMEVLQCWAAGGVENMSAQLEDFLPLEDVTGKTMQEVESEALCWLDTSERRAFHVLYSSPTSEDTESEYVSFENLVPTAITYVEGLLMEGLKIQSGMPDQEGASSIRAPGLVQDVDEWAKYLLPLEEWIRLDSGDIDAQDKVDEHMLKVFAAHCAKNIDINRVLQMKEDETVKLLAKRYGLLNSNFMMALKVQLRDPLHDFESIGSFMVALVQVERIYSPICAEQQYTSGSSYELEMGNLLDLLSQEGICFEERQSTVAKFPKFKVMGGALAGLNVLSAKQQFLGSSSHQQSGSKWLLSSGMAKTNEHPVSNSNADIDSSSRTQCKSLAEDVMWSISCHAPGEVANWNEPVALGVHVRNPDIIFSTEPSG